MDAALSREEKLRLAAGDAWAYFRYMMDFVGFTAADAKTIRESGLVIEKHLPAIVADFYDHLLRYPPTRQHFLKPDGAVDVDYLQKRMHHLTNFWRRTATGLYDDEYARYVDYVGRAHTAHGADPGIYIAERYVIGQVGFMQRAITEALAQELHEADPELERRAIRAWNMLMMVILELLARAYHAEEEGVSPGGAHHAVDSGAMRELAIETYEKGLGLGRPVRLVEISAGLVEEIPDGERKILGVGKLSIGVFHHRGEWYALKNHCLHRGGPVCTGTLEGDVLTCPWHGYQYNLTTGRQLLDASSRLETYPVEIRDGKVILRVPDTAAADRPAVGVAFPPATPGSPEVEIDKADPAGGARAGVVPAKPVLKENEFLLAELPAGAARQVHVDDQPVAVFNVAGILHAVSGRCTHAGGPLHEGTLDGTTVTCPIHGACFDVTSGEVRRGPARLPLQTYRVVVAGEIARVEKA